MNVIDLSHNIWEDMPVYPGTEKPKIQIANTHDKDGFTEKIINMYTHTGTHLDAPYHILKEGRTLDDYNLEKFVGQGTIIDVRGIVGNQIQRKDIEPYEECISLSEFVIMHTGWSKYWGMEDYYYNYPCFTQESIKWLSQFDLKGVGMDTISIDSIDTTNFINHVILMKRDMIIIENLCNLESIDNKSFLLVVVPLKIIDSDGSPVRATAIYK